MRIEEYELPKTGDYYAYKVSVFLNDVLKVSFTGRLTGTELSMALNKNKFPDQEEALVEFKEMVKQKAVDLYYSGNYKEGQSWESFINLA
jgi:hypothetical protein